MKWQRKKRKRNCRIKEEVVAEAVTTAKETITILPLFSNQDLTRTITRIRMDRGTTETLMVLSTTTMGEARPHIPLLAVIK
mmetsp:Transcript_44315/g.76514  ORF Transcript_44315/g.76514 Transcript_44315/m.76514 type:complete len:81 (+) Transcript_44315:192-434(+)